MTKKSFLMRRRLLIAVGLFLLIIIAPFFVNQLFIKVETFSNGQSASIVLGQSGFTTYVRGTTPSDTDLSQAFGMTVDSQGNVWVVDGGNNRILEFTKGSGFANGEAASIVIGQPNFTASENERTQTGLSSPYAIAFDSSGDLWVADSLNNRVLEYVPGTSPCSTGEFCNGMPASLVLGQSSFTTDSLSVTQSSINQPTALTFDSHGDLWVAEQISRVAEFVPGTSGCSSGEFCDDMNASLVIGQSSFTTDSVAVPPTASSLNWPEGLTFDSSGNLWVSDSSNNRVLEYVPGTSGCSTGEFCSGMSASLVLGQSGFTTSTNPLSTSPYEPSDTSLTNPIGITFDSSGNLWVADSNAHRVLEYLLGAGFTDDQAASLVIGQTSFTSDATPNPPTTPPTAAALYDPWGVSFDPSGNLWVSDYDDFRVLEYTGSTTSTTTTSSTSSTTTSSTSTSTSSTSSTTTTTTTTSSSSSTTTSTTSSSTSSLVATSIGVSCSPTTPETSTTCTATVSGGSSPTGEITWSSSSGTGIFGDLPCVLASGSCHVTYIDSVSGAPVITASYAGDSSHGASSGTTILLNFQSASSSLVSSGTTSGTGSLTVDQGSTGINTIITGASDNIIVQVESSDLGSSQPSGTGSQPIENGQFFDVEVSGTSSGTANICITGDVDSSTTMSYYSGGNWVTATGITRPALSSPPGASNGQICGNVPVADLTGTYFTEGDPLPSVTSSGPAASLVYGNITWTTPNFVGFEYFYTASVSINGVQFSTTFTETLFAQYQLTPGQPYAGFYGSTFGAISGCGQGSTITLTATVNGVTKSASGICPVAGNTTAINLSFVTTSGGTTSSVPIAPILLSYLISSLQPAMLIACFLSIVLIGKKSFRPFYVKTAGFFR